MNQGEKGFLKPFSTKSKKVRITWCGLKSAEKEYWTKPTLEHFTVPKIEEEHKN